MRVIAIPEIPVYLVEASSGDVGKHYTIGLDRMWPIEEASLATVFGATVAGLSLSVLYQGIPCQREDHPGD